MKVESRLRKIRLIAKTGTGDVYGVCIPPSLHNWIGVFVSIKESGNKLILESGCIPVAFTKKQINENSTNVEKIKI